MSTLDKLAVLVVVLGTCGAVRQSVGGGMAKQIDEPRAAANGDGGGGAMAPPTDDDELEMNSAAQQKAADLERNRGIKVVGSDATTSANVMRRRVVMGGDELKLTVEKGEKTVCM